MVPLRFLERMRQLLGDEYAAFEEAYSSPLRRGLRVNTLKCDPARLERYFAGRLEPTVFSEAGYVLSGDHRAGADPLHHAGAYYMQEPSAMSAVTVLAPQPGERVLDLCAAPGGKSTQIAAALGGRGLLWSNEYVRSRAQILCQNLERCGVTNAVVSSTDAVTLGEGLAGYFDAVLVDAPCSGEGMFRKEPAAIEQWSEDYLRLCAARQREILAAAAAAVRSGGRLVYSTCTFAPEENECVVAWFLHARPDFHLVELGSREIAFGMPAFDWERVAPFAPSDVDGRGLPLSRARRILPQQGGEGHFVALLEREESGDADAPRPYEYPKKDTNSIELSKLYELCFGNPLPGRVVTTGEAVRLLPEGLPRLDRLGVLSAGVAAAAICKNRLEPCHAVFMAARVADCRRVLDLSPEDLRLTAFLRGETVGCDDIPDGWTAVAVDGVVTGFGKAVGGVLKNRYPKGLRLRQSGVRQSGG